MISGQKSPAIAEQIAGLYFKGLIGASTAVQGKTSLGLVVLPVAFGKSSAL
jgi:hypothetical protein